ncbi:MAG: glycosyltransferase family A protein [Elusimicrobia bacterium]|nr:glycosyltransferase family A protein [Elusimicrobiota bacterium]
MPASRPEAPLVSVVIPAYNAAAFIEKTLDTVRAQTFKDYEVIVVDDGSTDGTCEVALRYLARHGLRGRAIRQENKKIAAARNTGMRAAQGAYIALLDHDDLWRPEKLEEVMAEFKRRPEVDLVCHNENIVKDGVVVRTSANGPGVDRMYDRLLMAGNALSPSASVFKKEKALAIGGMRENPEFNTVEDYDFWMRLSKTARFHFLGRVLGEYQLVERAASRRVEYHHSNLEALLHDHFKTRFGERPSLSDRLRMRRRLASVYRSALGQLMFHGEDPELQVRYLRRMLSTFPWDPRNLARAFLWLLRRGR